MTNVVEVRCPHWFDKGERGRGLTGLVASNARCELADNYLV